MDRTIRRALWTLFALAIGLAIKITFFSQKVTTAVESRDTTGSHAWTLDGKNDFTASLEPWPVKAGEETHLVVWYAHEPSTYRIVTAGKSPDEWMPLALERVKEGLEEGEPTFFHKATVKLPAGECSIELRVKDSNGDAHDLTGWKVTAK